jgi:hypothetical protein
LTTSGGPIFDQVPQAPDQGANDNDAQLVGSVLWALCCLTLSMGALGMAYLGRAAWKLGRVSRWRGGRFGKQSIQAWCDNFRMKTYKKIFAAALLSCLFAGPTLAETVYVKYRGPVNLDNFQCAQLSSSFVHRICYQSAQQYVIVLLDRTYYHYCNMPSAVIRQWLGAPSQGKFYRTYIKGRYDCRLGGQPR